MYTQFLFVFNDQLCFLFQYGDEHLKEIEDLWSALCTWPQNIRSTLNFLARLTCVSGNLSVMLQQAKRIMVCFSRTKPASIVSELMRDLRVCYNTCLFMYVQHHTCTCTLCFVLLYTCTTVTVMFDVTIMG